MKISKATLRTWTKYTTGYKRVGKDKLVAAIRKAIRNTKFQPPVSKGSGVRGKYVIRDGRLHLVWSKPKK